MNIKSYNKGAVIFRQGDPGDCMYDIQFGKVGIFDHYGEPDEKKIADLYVDQLFGEMGLLDHAPRSATAVALEDETCVAFVTEESFGEFFEKNPARVLMVMQQLSQNLRKRTKDYVEVCRTIHEQAVKEENA